MPTESVAVTTMVLNKILTDDELRLVRFALADAAANVGRDTLDALGLLDLDPAEHGTEDSGFTDAAADAVLDFREETIAGKFRGLLALFGGE